MSKLYWDDLPAFMVLSTLVVAFISPVIGRWKKEACGYLALFISTLNFVLTILIVRVVLTVGSQEVYMGGWEPPWGIELRVDEVSLMMLLVITGICFVIVLYSQGALEKEVSKANIGWYYTGFMLAMAGMMGMMVTNDLFNLYVMLEIVGICSIALVIAGGSKEATEASLKYLLLATIGSGFILFAIGFLYMITGNLNFDFVAQELDLVKDNYPYLIWATISFLVVGFGLKSALFPLHLWLPDAHSAAPSSSSALLSGLVVKVYVVALWKLLYQIFGLSFLQDTLLPTFLLVLSALAILAGSFFAFTQLDLKRRLAYSTVAQIGYIFLGFSLGPVWGILAALFHIIVHAVMKTCLFMSAGAIYRQTGLKRVTRLHNIGSTMPITMAAFTVASLSMVGIPFMGGFITKYGLAISSLETGRGLFMALVVLSGLLNAAYYFPIIRLAYFAREKSQAKVRIDRVPITTIFSVGILALGIIYLGVFPEPIIDFLERAVYNFITPL